MKRSLEMCADNTRSLEKITLMIFILLDTLNPHCMESNIRRMRGNSEEKVFLPFCDSFYTNENVNDDKTGVPPTPQDG